MPAHPLRVLLAETGASETGAALRSLCENRGRTLELYLVSKRSTVALALLESNAHIAFLSLGLFQPDPLRAVLRLHRAAPQIPLILFALPADTACAAACLQSGATDYLLEGYMDGPTLDRVLHAATQCPGNPPVRILPRSRCDSLTRLPNRSGLLHQLQNSLEESPLTDSCLIFSIQVKNLKTLLAAAGKPALEKTLQQVARRLVGSVRRSDLVAHVSKGVFIVVVSNAGEASLRSLERRMETTLLRFTQRPADQGPVYFALQNSLWNSSSAHSFSEALAAHLPARRRSPEPSLREPAFALAPAGAGGEK